MTSLMKSVVFTACFTLHTLYGHGDEESLTQLRPSYGVNFDKVGEVVDSVGMTFYEHTWLIAIPKLVPSIINTIGCEKLPLWGSQCSAINDMIAAFNALMYESHRQARDVLHRALAMVPHKLNDTRGENRSTYRDRGRRKKRNVNETEYIMDRDPSWLKQSTWDEVNKELPTHTMGQVFADLFHTPGPRAVEKLKSRLRDSGKAIYANVQSAVSLNDRLASIMLTMDQRASSLQKEGDQVTARVDRVRTKINNMYIAAGNFSTNLTRRMDFITDIMELLVSHMEPVFVRCQLTIARVRRLAEYWERGIMRLVQGYLSPDLIGESQIEAIIKYIDTEVLKENKYSEFKLVNKLPTFYYQLKHVMYGRMNGMLHVTISIPMYRLSGLVPLYRVDVYPVPIIAGIAVKGGEDKGYTKLTGMSAFIGISSDLQNYMELTTSQFLSCSWGTSKIYSCGYGISALRRKNSRVASCAYLVFMDDHKGILEHCSVRYSKSPPMGSAKQLNVDSTFLMHSGSSNRTHWTMSCPGRRQNNVQKVRVCAMCRIRIPCRCLLTADDFFIPRRMSGCVEYGPSKTTAVTTYYHRNLLAMHGFVPESIITAMDSYVYRRNRLYPPFKMSRIDFVADNMTKYVSASQKYRTDFKKALVLAKKQSQMYETKSKELLAKAINFTGDVTSRSTDLGGALHHFVSGIFGNDIWAILATIFAPMGLSIIAFLLAFVLFLPEFTVDMARFSAYIIRQCQERREDQEMKALINTYSRRSGFLCEECESSF